MATVNSWLKAGVPARLQGGWTQAVHASIHHLHA